METKIPQFERDSTMGLVVLGNAPKKVTWQEVRQLLREVGEGKLKPILANKTQTWDTVYAGEVHFKVGGWKVVVFNDCDDFDYVDNVTAPDGRRGVCGDWICSECDTNVYPNIQLMFEDKAVHLQMVRAFKKAV